MTLVWRPGYTWNETVWNPSMISASLWLDAADTSTVTTVSGAVSQWNDKSGNARHATQSTAGNRPAYTNAGLNSKNVLTFTAASSHFLNIPTISLTDNNTFVASVYQRTSAGVKSIDIGDAGTPGDYANYWFDDNILYSLLRGTGSQFGTHGSASTATGGFINVVARNNTGTQAWRNGSALGTRQQSGATENRQFTVVGRVSSVYHTGYIAEIIVGRFDISDTDRQKIEGYLAHKWGLEASLPAGHPYKTTGPTP